MTGFPRRRLRERDAAAIEMHLDALRLNAIHLPYTLAPASQAQVRTNLVDRQRGERRLLAATRLESIRENIHPRKMQRRKLALRAQRVRRRAAHETPEVLTAQI